MRPLAIAAAVVVTGGVAAGLIFAFRATRAEREQEAAGEGAFSAPARVEADKDGGTPVIRLDDDALERIHLHAVTLVAATLRPVVAAYGKLEADPARGFTLRAPFAGTLLAAEGRAWPGIGDRVAAGDALGRIAPRLQAVETLDVATRLAGARAEIASAEASVAAARAAFDRAKALNADKNVSDRVREEAEAKLRGEEARLEGARASARVLEGGLTGAATASTLLRAASPGEVVEVLAQPGEAVESGAPIVRIQDFGALLARVELPVGTRLPTATAARVAPVGLEDAPLAAEPLAPAAGLDPQAQAPAWLLRVPAAGTGLRPGMAVTAWLESGGPPLSGVVVPRSGVVRLNGLAWVYAGIGPGAWTRREVALDHPLPEGWLVTANLAPGEPIVVASAGILLSEELKSEIELEGD